MARTPRTSKSQTKRSKQAPKPKWEEVPAAELEARLGPDRTLFAMSIREEGPDGELRPLSQEELDEVTSPDAIRELMEDEFPPEARAALSTEPLNRRSTRSAPLPPFQRLRTGGEGFDRAHLAEDVLEVLSLAQALLADRLGRGAPLPYELAAVRAISEVLEKYRDARTEHRRRARRAISVGRLADIYERVQRAWPREAPGTGEEKIGPVKTKVQRAAIDRARADLLTFLSVQFDDLPDKARDATVTALLVDGLYIRKHGGPIKVASKLLEGLLVASQRTLLEARTMSGIELSRTQLRPAFVPPSDLWTAFGTTEGAELVVKDMVSRVGQFAADLVRQVAAQRAKTLTDTRSARSDRAGSTKRTTS